MIARGPDGPNRSDLYPILIPKRLNLLPRFEAQRFAYVPRDNYLKLWRYDDN